MIIAPITTPEASYLRKKGFVNIGAAKIGGEVIKVFILLKQASIASFHLKT